MSAGPEFNAKLCECGHTYGRHPWYDNPRGPRPGFIPFQVCDECGTWVTQP